MEFVSGKAQLSGHDGVSGNTSIQVKILQFFTRFHIKWLVEVVRYPKRKEIGHFHFFLFAKAITFIVVYIFKEWVV